LDLTAAICWIEFILEIVRSVFDTQPMNATIKPRGRKAVRVQRSRVKELAVGKVRSALGWSRNQLAYVMNASDRAIVNWEQGDPISPIYAAKLREIQSVHNELKQLMKPEEIGTWLLSEMEEFEGRTPADLISKGETGRLWASLFYLRSGMPD
jgi:DNA-binding transcriptional regulator YiaG